VRIGGEPKWPRLTRKARKSSAFEALVRRREIGFKTDRMTRTAPAD
jgi:hypothetical protein